MKLEKYISDLLYRYDLVVVPGFGSIIGRKKNARIDQDTYIFSPPYKELSFNVNLQENDGLLVRYIADLLHVSNAEALSQIEQTVTQWKNILHSTGSLKLDQIGVFKLLNNDRIIYMPLTTRNYLSDAYGLTAFVRRPIDIEQHAPETISKTPVKPQNITATLKSAPRNIRKKNTPWQYMPIVKYAAIFVLGLGIFGAVAKYYQTSHALPVEKFQKATFVLPNDFPAITIGNSAPQKQSMLKISQEESFFIIADAFRNKQNAERKTAMLKSKGYDAKIIQKSQQDFYMVAYQGFITVDEAREKLQEIKNIQQTAWIYNKN